MGLRVGMEGHVCLACIAESKTRSEQKRVIQSDQDVQACGLYLVIHGLTLLHDSFSFDISNCGLSLFSSLFLTCLCKHVFGYASFLSSRSFMFYILTKAKLSPLFFLPANQAYLELWVGKVRHVCFACIVKSKTRSEQKRVIQPDQEVQVCGIFSVENELLFMIHLSPLFILDMGYLLSLFF